MDDDWDFCDQSSGPSYIQNSARAPSLNEISRFLSIKSNASSLTQDGSRNPTLMSVNGKNDSKDEKNEAATFRRQMRNMGIQELHRMPPSMLLALANRMSIDQINTICGFLINKLENATPYFFYGSSAFPAALRKIIRDDNTEDLALRMTPGLLRGWKRLAVRGKDYPALVATHDNDDVVPGMVVFGIREHQRPLIDAFESNLFSLATDVVLFELPSNAITMTKASFYVWNQGHDRLIPEEEGLWRPEDLLKSEWHKTLSY